MDELPRLPGIGPNYEAMVEEGQALLLLVDRGARIVYMNRRCEHATGLLRDQATGQPWTSVFDETHNAEELLARVQKASQGFASGPFESNFRHKNGSLRRIRWQLDRLPSHAASGLVCALGIDLTNERLLAERTELSERMAILSSLAAGLAHEIRNPLNSAHLQLVLLQRKLARGGHDTPSALDAALRVGGELERLAALIEEFLDYARPQPLRLDRGDLYQMASEVIDHILPEARCADVTLELEPGEETYTIFDEERMKQVLKNLVRNALDAVSQGGRIRVRTRLEPACAVLEVEDDGFGLPHPSAPIFEPFFTTKEQGIGLGLAIAQRIVSEHGGDIRAQSLPGVTQFVVRLPRMPQLGRTPSSLQAPLSAEDERHA